MSRVPRLQPRHALAAALLAAAVILGLAVPGIVGFEGAVSAHAAPAESESALQPTMVVAPEAPIVRSSAEEFRFEVLLKNPGSEPLGGGTVVLMIDTQRAETEEDLQHPSEREALELARVEAVETSPEGEQRLDVVVARDDVPFLFSRQAGVYAVRASFTPSGQVTPAPTVTDAPDDETAEVDDGLPLTLLASTPLVWNGVDAPGQLPLTLIVPIVLPGSVETLPGRDELARVAPRLLQVLDAAEQRNATVAVDPRIVAGIRALGSNAPSSSVTLLHRLERTTSPVFLLQFADADPAVQAALGFDELMQPLGFSHATDLGKFEPPSPESGATPGVGEADASAGNGNPPGDTAESDTTAETDAGNAAEGSSGALAPQVDPVTGVPTFEGLLTLANAKPGAWPAGGEVDSATLALLQQSGLTSLVLDSSNVSNATSPRVTMGEFDALIADTSAGQAARRAIAGETATDRSAGAADLAARLALSAQNETGGAVLALDRGALADIADPLRIFQTIDDLPWVQTVSERQQTSGTAVLRAGTSTEERRELLRATITRSTQIDELAPQLDHPAYLLEYQRERLLEALATEYAEPGVDFAEIDSAIKERDEELLQGVRPVVTENTQLVGALSHVPVTLTNALPFEAVVSLRAAPTSAAISLTERDFEARVPAVGSTNVLVPVHSRISSGETGLMLEVRDRSGEQSFADALLPLTLRTTIETMLMWVLGTAAALLLGFGIWRSVRRRRASSSGTADAGTDAERDVTGNASSDDPAPAHRAGSTSETGAR